ncbi:hypothetical protein [Bacillus weihaiensis]|uniref:hypothetical protein n=1 Tax=Bacillus weihaiensis TaxID=1547283 RepID=UPI002354D1F7|nr:hypothetical protein [Bacillus weihaiensis]
MFLVSKSIDTLVESLSNHTETLIKKLKEIEKYNFFPNIDLLDFVVFMNQTSFDIRMFSMDRENNEVFKESEHSSLFAGSQEIISDVEFRHILDEQFDEFYSVYEENEEELWPKEEKAIAEWFQNCWKAAETDVLKLPSYFVFHDASDSFDLTSWKWIDENEKYS